MRGKVDLNADMGESYGAVRVGSDDELVELVTSASLACGLHGGDPLTMKRTVELCKGSGVRIGAHPSFPDLEGFGRREMEMGGEELRAIIVHQISTLREASEAAGVSLQHVKPHGALYNMAARRRDYSEAIASAVSAVSKDLVLIALPASTTEEVAKGAGLTVAREGFPERGYLDDGRLAPRGLEGALVTDPRMAAERAASMAAHGVVVSLSGKEVKVDVDTLCVHSDTPGAPAIAREIRRRLKEEGVEVLPLDQAMGRGRR